MQVLKEKNGSTLNVRLIGKLDTTTSPLVEAEIAVELEDINELIIDLKEVDYVSSSGLRLFLILQKSMVRQNGTMKLINVTDFIAEILDITGFMEILDVELEQQDG